MKDVLLSLLPWVVFASVGPVIELLRSCRDALKSWPRDPTLEPSFVSEVDGFKISLEALENTGRKTNWWVVRVMHDDLGGDFTLILDGAEGSSTLTGDSAFDTRAHIETSHRIETLATLDAPRRAALLALAAQGQVRLSSGRLDLVLPTTLFVESQPISTDQVLELVAQARIVREAPRPEVAIPELLSRLETAPIGERVAVARALVSVSTSHPEVRRALAAARRGGDPEVRWVVSNAIGVALDLKMLASDTQVPTTIRIKAYELAVAKQSERATKPASAAERRGNPPDSLPFSAADAFVGQKVDGLLTDQPPPDRDALATLIEALRHPRLRHRALRAALELEWQEVVPALVRLPRSVERDGLLSRLRTRREAATGQLKLAPDDEGGELALAEEED